MSAYYNDNDQYAAQWLRNLIAAGLIADGEVDQRSIKDVRADDLRGFAQCHFFAGIGGWSVALRLAGWPDDRPVWTGSCPCQPFSAAGAGKAADDSRHLWPAWFRLIDACRPAIIFGEQVASSLVVGEGMQDLRRDEADDSVPNAQQGRLPWDLSGLRQHRSSRSQTVAIPPEKSIPKTSARNASRFCTDERCETAGAGEGNTLRVGLEGDSGTDQYWALRSDWHSLQPLCPEGVERAFPGSGGTASGLHTREHASGSICAEHNGERVGYGPNNSDRGRHTGETVRQRIQRIIAEDRGSAENQSPRAWLDIVRFDLANAGYTLGACVLPACCVGSPHIRQRCWFVADAECSERGSLNSAYGRNRSHTLSQRQEGTGRLGGREQDGELAYANGGNAGTEGLQRSWEHGQRAQDGCAGEFLADTESGGQREFGDASRPRSGGHADGGFVSGELGDTESDNGWREQQANGTECRRAGLTGTGFWRDLEWLQCTDGKSRPTKPGVFPLAHGVQRRTSKLRAYGNAIVPQTAAEFIKAYTHAREG